MDTTKATAEEITAWAKDVSDTATALAARVREVDRGQKLHVVISLENLANEAHHVAQVVGALETALGGFTSEPGSNG